MKKVYEIKTPVGDYGIRYGEFMSGDGRKNKFSCWWNGCGIGNASKSTSFGKTLIYLENTIRVDLTLEIEKLENTLVEAKCFLENLTLTE